MRNAGESTGEAPGEENADDEAADTSDKYKLVTDEESLARVTHLPKGRAYTLRETLPRFDLGYVTSDWSETRFLANDGCWYESENVWIEASNAGCEGENEGDALWKETIENDFTHLAFFKVDAERYEQASKAHADDGSAEQAASQARIEGGKFRLEDSQGNPIEPCNEGLEAEGWAAQGKTPVEFNHLRVGETYVLTEACAPEGYKAENQELRIEIRDTPEIEIAILKNKRIKPLPKTLDFATSLIKGAAGPKSAPDRCSVNLSQHKKAPALRGLLAFSKNELFQSSLRDLDQRGKSLGVVDGHVGEHLTVELDASLVEAIHKHGVGHTVDTSSSVDAGNPETTNLALLVATIAVLVLQRVTDLLLRLLIMARLSSVVALRTSEDNATLLLSGNRTLNTWH